MNVSPGQLFRIALAGEGRGLALASATALLMLHALAEAAIPVLIGATIDRAVLPSDPRALGIWLAALLGTFLVLTSSYQLASRLMVRVYGTGEQALRHLALARILRPRLSQLRLTPGEALTYVTSDTYRVAGVAWSVAQQSATLASLAGAACAMFVISPVAALVVFAATVGMMLVMRWVSRPLERRGQAEQAAATEAGAVAADFMTGYRVLVGMGARSEAVRRYDTASDRSRRAATLAGRSLAGYGAVSAVLAALATTVLVGVSAWFASNGTISIGELVTVLGLAQFISGSLAHAGSFPSNWIHKLASARRLATVINAEDLLPEPREHGVDTAGDEPVPRTGPAETLLSFTVAGQRVAVRRGELLGIRAAGSDAARALSRQLGLREDPSAAEIEVLIDGVFRPVGTLDPVEYRRHVVALPHRHTLATGTLRDAVRGRGEATPDLGDAPSSGVDDRAVRTAALGDAVAQIGGWDAQVGESGRRLSGGQQQRVGLARGLHAGAQVLVLDEPTSALDALTESQIAAELARHPSTVIAITTSPALLAACDRVVDLPGEHPGAAHEGAEYGR
ncbi:ABC transporter transmembrane domain-containing protein [Leucobacter chromiireducens]